MIERHLQLRGIIDPAELSLLQKVFNELCRGRELDPDGEEAAACARRLLALFQAGIRDTQKLLAMLRGN